MEDRRTLLLQGLCDDFMRDCFWRWFFRGDRLVAFLYGCADRHDFYSAFHADRYGSFLPIPAVVPTGFQVFAGISDSFIVAHAVCYQLMADPGHHRGRVSAGEGCDDE